MEVGYRTRDYPIGIHPRAGCQPASAHPSVTVSPPNLFIFTYLIKVSWQFVKKIKYFSDSD